MELRSTITSFLFIFGVLAFIADLGGGFATATTMYSTHGLLQETNNTLPTMHRKFIHHGSAIAKAVVNDKCTNSIKISQNPSAPLPNGIPTYTVEIANTCVHGCVISNIHFHCGWFSSAILINPRIFKRLRYDDCLVNGGNHFPNGNVITFRYATTFPYTLSVSSLVCN